MPVEREGGQEKEEHDAPLHGLRGLHGLDIQIEFVQPKSSTFTPIITNKQFLIYFKEESTIILHTAVSRQFWVRNW